MIAKIRPVIEGHFGLFLLAAFMIGLTVPGLKETPKIVILILQALIILFACSKIKLDDFRGFKPKEIAGFYILRFIILPVIMFYIASWLVPDYRYALLLLGLMPCGATLPAMMSIMGGNPALGLTATTVSGLLSPFIVFAMFAAFSTLDLQLDLWGMFQTLFFVIFCPVIVYFAFLRRFEPLKLTMRTNASMMAILLIFGVIMIVVAYQKDRFFTEPAFFFAALAIGALTYFIYYALGWFLFSARDLKTRISYALMGGNNNIALAISLAALYFPEKEMFILVVWEILWIMGVTLFQLYVKNLPSHKAA
ncbi:MAG: hypothetical protein H6858_00160 [Rhodospirillales bacterium]|nr:hypothetical protein [Alphaproteobacteria bacterium]MCB1840265.1 hypothetical protein [Alphaproteobacteria bacterium]MCB9975992.1 hypothetical protein [Rhodospirillales bacterium]